MHSPIHLETLANMDNNFGYILNTLTTISMSKCLLYSYSQKLNFTGYAVKYLVIY
jgi:hypothetical protein